VNRALVDRLLDPDNGSAAIESLQRTAKIIGRELRLRLVQQRSSARPPRQKAALPFDRGPWRGKIWQRGRGCMEDIVAQRAAERLLTEHKANVRFKPFGPPDGPATIADAYDIQDRYVALLRGEHGEAVGYKIGLTSAPMQAFCGIGHPIAGVVLADRLHQSGATVRRSDFGRLGLEFEIAVRIKSDVPVADTPYTAAMIAPHIDGVCAAIELVDDRNADYTNLDVLALVADNSWNGGVVLSTFSTSWPDLANAEGKATRDSSSIGGGHGRDILGHPFNSAAWLAQQLASRNEKLRAGQIVMTGSVMKTIFPDEAASFRFDLEGVGSVGVTVM
jgi:2-keto-4-pentenoate hydratase